MSPRDADSKTPSSGNPGINTAEGATKFKPFTSSSALVFNFIMMSLCFSANHGCVTALIAVGSSVGTITEALSGYQNGSLYVMYTLSALLFANAVVSRIGDKWTIFAGLAFYCIYVASYLIAVYISGMAQTVMVIGSGIIAGLGAGVLWTGQGKFFTSTAEQYAKINNIEVPKATAYLGALFTVFYLGIEIIMKILTSAIVVADNKSLLFAIFTIVAAVSTVGMTLVRPVTDPAIFKKKDARTPMTAKLAAAMTLAVNDPKVLLMAPYNFTFGFAAPFMNQYVNAGITTKILGNCGKCESKWVSNVTFMQSYDYEEVGFGIDNIQCNVTQTNGCGLCNVTSDNGYKCDTIDRVNNYVGWMTSSLVLAAVTASVVFGYVVKNDIMPKTIPMIFGACCFMVLGIVFLMNTEEQIGKWDLVIPLYLLFGIGRGVWESTTKSVFADFFPGEKATAGFANIVWQNGLPGAIGFFAFPHMGKEAKALLLIACGVSGIIGYLMAHGISKREAKDRASLQAQSPNDEPEKETARLLEEGK